ncbi:pentapeptide repeat-containing protein [Pseudomonas taiwanensis]|uniref:pentapeptide repeat-containing protein n=1 Tax=Pseudomonas taiwanensis TaxID=470150 RepID=UPI0009DC2035
MDGAILCRRRSEARQVLPDLLRPCCESGCWGADTDFAGADLRHADFRLAYLARSSFQKARLDGTDFRGAVTTRSRLIGATGDI